MLWWRAIFRSLNIQIIQSACLLKNSDNNASIDSKTSYNVAKVYRRITKDINIKAPQSLQLSPENNLPMNVSHNNQLWNSCYRPSNLKHNQ